MIYPDVTVTEWIRKHPSLKVVSTSCSECGSKIYADRPFVSQDYVGLESRPCSCGNARNTAANAVTRTKKAYDEWEAALGFHE